MSLPVPLMSLTIESEIILSVLGNNIWSYIQQNTSELIGQRYMVQIDHKPKHRMKAAKDSF